VQAFLRWFFGLSTFNRGLVVETHVGLIGLIVWGIDSGDLGVALLGGFPFGFLFGALIYWGTVYKLNREEREQGSRKRPQP
jgi:hypothetical protein